MPLPSHHKFLTDLLVGILTVFVLSVIILTVSDNFVRDF